jgi:hypothetical protein
VELPYRGLCEVRLRFHVAEKLFVPNFVFATAYMDGLPVDGIVAYLLGARGWWWKAVVLLYFPAAVGVFHVVSKTMAAPTSDW